MSTGLTHKLSLLPRDMKDQLEQTTRDIAKKLSEHIEKELTRYSFDFADRYDENQLSQIKVDSNDSYSFLIDIYEEMVEKELFELMKRRVASNNNIVNKLVSEFKPKHIGRRLSRK